MEREGFGARIFSAEYDHVDLPERVWRMVEPLLPSEQPKPRGGKPREVSDRAALAGIIYVARERIGWTRLPLGLGYGHGRTCRRRLHEWRRAGVWDEIRAILIKEIAGADSFDWARIEYGRTRSDEDTETWADSPTQDAVTIVDLGGSASRVASHQVERSKARGRQADAWDRAYEDLKELELMVSHARDLTKNDVDAVELHAPHLWRRAELLMKSQVGSELREIGRCMWVAAHVWRGASYQEAGNPAALEDGLSYVRQAGKRAKDLAPPSDSFWRDLARWYEGTLLRKQAKFLRGAAQDSCYQKALKCQLELMDETIWPELRAFACAELIKLGLATGQFAGLNEWLGTGRTELAKALAVSDGLAREDPRPRTFPQHVNAVFFDAVIRLFKDFPLKKRNPLDTARAAIEQHWEGLSDNLAEATMKLGQAEALLSSPHLSPLDRAEGFTKWLEGLTYSQRTKQEQQVLRAEGLLRNRRQHPVYLPNEFKRLCTRCNATTIWTLENGIYRCSGCPRMGGAKLVLPA